MDQYEYDNYHIAIVAPLQEDFETARALLHDSKTESRLTPSKAACSLGKLGPHNVVLVGKAEDMLKVSRFVEDAVADLLKKFSSIRAGFLIGVDATAPKDSIANPGDLVVGLPQAFQPGLVQFDGNKTSLSNRISTTFELSHTPSAVKIALDASRSSAGRQQWGQYLNDQLSRTELTCMKVFGPLKHDYKEPNKVLCGKIASAARILPDRDLINKIGSDSKIMCFERAAACLKSRLPFLTICGIVSSTSSPKVDESIIHHTRMAAVMYTMFVAREMSPVQLEAQHNFTSIFQYESFDLEKPGFRLMRLERGQQSQLRCHLFQAYLDEEDLIPYAALSYVWGGQNTPHEILVNGKTLWITESLYEALHRLRKPNKDRIFWVDALCIDQNNIKERGHQVNHMGEIYKKAIKVIIWLGYVGGDVVRLQSAIKKFADQLPPEAYQKWPRQDRRLKGHWKQVQESHGAASCEGLINTLHMVMENSWFSRVWILQEVANAKRAIVICNQGKLPTRTLALLPYAMGLKISEQCQAVLDIMPGPLRRSSWWNQNRSLCHLLWKFRGCQATDPRDRVFALLGMASDMEDTSIRADYAKTEHEVMRDLCGYLWNTQWPVNGIPTSNIEELQSELPDVSKQVLLQILEERHSAASLERFLLRQGTISRIYDSNLLEIMQYGSKITTLFMDKTEITVQLSPDNALHSLQKYPHVFETLLPRSDFSIELTPAFIVQATEYRPDLLEKLLGLSSNPEVLRDDALMEAISRGITSCKPLLDNCSLPIKITTKMLRKAMVCNQKLLRYLLGASQSPVQLLENVYLVAAPRKARGIQILDEQNRVIKRITKELIDVAREAGNDVVQLFLDVLECPKDLRPYLYPGYPYSH
ncbi:heterokaryon incompatibility [Fusarium beomiforme]|uniref:Heterokaryon incompatibility n=1 Tax=Fusarium beomiforme TaxID=44412 RepID=A0A9P5AEM7_9HYPO|nr:heterokaryon incompatibility [Fusarium beomiforme]